MTTLRVRRVAVRVEMIDLVDIGRQLLWYAPGLLHSSSTTYIKYAIIMNKLWYISNIKIYNWVYFLSTIYFREFPIIHGMIYPICSRQYFKINFPLTWGRSDAKYTNTNICAL